MKEKNWLIISVVAIISIIMVLFIPKVIEHKREEEFSRYYNMMNEDYKEVLYATGQKDQASGTLMKGYAASWDAFSNEYGESPIEPYSRDAGWKESMTELNDAVTASDGMIKEGEFEKAHEELEKVRSIWQQIFTRNHVSSLGFELTEFHTLMEEAIGFGDDAAKIKEICPSLARKWDEIRKLEEAGAFSEKSEEMARAIESLCTATDGQKEKAAKLKPLFVSIYLKYG